MAGEGALATPLLSPAFLSSVVHGREKPPKLGRDSLGGEVAALIPRRAHTGLQGQQLGRWPVQTGGRMVGHKGTGKWAP